MTTLKNRTLPIAAIIALLILTALPVLAYAQRGGPGGGRDAPMGGRMHDRMAERLDRMADILNLTTEQRTLMETMKLKSEAFRTQNAFCGHDVHRSIMDEVRKDKPNLASLGKTLKGEPLRKSNTAYTEMVDASIAFFGSLTAEQRALMSKGGMGPDERGNRGNRGFRGDGQGYYNDGKGKRR